MWGSADVPRAGHDVRLKGPVQEQSGRHRPVGLDQQHCQHAPLPGGPDVDDAAAETHLDLAEQAKLDRHDTTPLPTSDTQPARLYGSDPTRQMVATAF
jgi:hypothetical protein